MSKEGLYMLRKQGPLWGQNIEKMNFYEHCVFRKQKRISFSWPIIYRTSSTVDNIHPELWGPFHIAFMGDDKYILTFVDDYSKILLSFIFWSVRRTFSYIFSNGKFWRDMDRKQIKMLRIDDFKFCVSNSTVFLQKWRNYCTSYCEGDISIKWHAWIYEQNSVGESPLHNLKSSVDKYFLDRGDLYNLLYYQLSSFCTFEL